VAWQDLPRKASAVVLAVSHSDYVRCPVGERLTLLRTNGLFVDVKAAFDLKGITAHGHQVWRM